MGGLPSGDDPSQFDLGDYGMVGTEVSALHSRTQSSVENFYKAQVRNSPGWNGAHHAAFDGLLGVPGDPLKMRILVTMASKLFNKPDTTWTTIEDVVADLGEVPLIGNLVEIVTGIEDGDLNDFGTFINNIRSAVGDVIDNITNAFFGQDSFLGMLVGDARAAMDKMYNDLLENTLSLQALQARDSGETATGKSVVVNFNDYPDGPMPSIFTISYTGPGSAALSIDNGKAGWDKASNTTRVALIRYNVAPTDTDFQLLRGTMATPPEDSTNQGGQPYFYARARVSADEQDYVWCRAWSVGSFFLYRADIGRTIKGASVTWASNIPLTWSTSMSFIAGVGTDERQFQIFSGGSLVHSETETPTVKVLGGACTINSTTSITVTIPGHGWSIPLNSGFRVWVGNYSGTGTFIEGRADIASISGNNVTFTVPTGFDVGSGTCDVLLGSMYGPNHRWWGSQTNQVQGANHPNTAGKLAGCAVADNELPTIKGTSAMMYRTSTSSVNYAGGDTVVDIPSNFFQFIGRSSRDIASNPGAGTFTVSKEGLYGIRGRILLNGSVSGRCDIVLKINGVVSGYGNSVFPSTAADMCIAGQWMEYLEAGDVVSLAGQHAGVNVNVFSGEATGTKTKFELGLINGGNT